jgi:hypothetical protein
MFDVIDFLESVGQDAQWRHADTEALGIVLTEAQIDPDLRAAILARDGRDLSFMLGKSHFCCYINPGKEEDEEGEGDKDKDKDNEGIDKHV